VFVPPLLHRKSSKYYIVWVCVCSPRYPACNAHAPYCYLWPVRLSMFFHIISWTAWFSKKKVVDHKMCFLFLTTSAWNVSHFKKKCVKYNFKNVHWSKCKLRIILVIFQKKTWIFSTDFQIILKYQISWKSVQWKSNCSVLTGEWTNRQTWGS
jgi:hypothetical protein